MREMKNSGIEWIGEIPANWTLARVKYFYNITLGKMVDSYQYPEEHMSNYLCAANIGHVLFKTQFYSVVQTAIPLRNYCIIGIIQFFILAMLMQFATRPQLHITQRKKWEPRQLLRCRLMNRLEL